MDISAARIFSLQLSSIKRFTFDDILYSRTIADRKARTTAPLILMSGFHRPLQGIENLVTLQGNPYALFQVCECAGDFSVDGDV